MKKIIIAFALMISSVFAEDYTDKCVKPAVEFLKNNEYEKAIIQLVKGSIIEDKVLKVQQTKDSWISNFDMYKTAYGKYTGFEKVHEASIGNLTKVYYLIYCKDYALQLTVLLYKVNDQYKLVNIEYNDKVLPLPEMIQMMKNNPAVSSAVLMNQKDQTNK